MVLFLKFRIHFLIEAYNQTAVKILISTLNFAYKISDNIGVLSEISYSKGEFEDELEEILSIEVQHTVDENSNKQLALKWYSDELKALVLDLMEKRSQLAAVITQLQGILEELEEEGLF